MNSPGPTKLGYIPALDGLRGVAISLVVLLHAEVPAFRWGGVGVDIFFVLSGFLITSILLKEWQQTGNISLSRFYARRALRLLPALYVMLAAIAVGTVLYWRGPLADVNWIGIVMALTYTSNFATYIGIPALGAISQTWSLAVEEQFYLLWPFVLLLVLPRLRIGRGLVSLVCGLLIATVALWLAGFDTRAYGLLAGCLVAVLLIRYPAIRQHRAMRLLSPLSRALAWKPLVWIGIVSYGIYLWHAPIFVLLPVHDWLDWPVQLVRLALTAAAVTLSYFLIERPALALKKRFSPSVPSAVQSSHVYNPTN